MDKSNSQNWPKENYIIVHLSSIKVDQKNFIKEKIDLV